MENTSIEWGACWKPPRAKTQSRKEKFDAVHAMVFFSLC